jgi:hypothetical protein
MKIKCKDNLQIFVKCILKIMKMIYTIIKIMLELVHCKHEQINGYNLVVSEIVYTTK